MHDRQELGQRGEELAVGLLQKLGYQIIDRNWRFGRLGEIDLVAQLGDWLIFVEVRIRRGRHCGTPEESITRDKMRRLMRLGEAYVHTHQWERNWRIDVVAIELDELGRLLRQEHFPSAITGWD